MKTIKEQIVTSIDFETLEVTYENESNVNVTEAFLPNTAYLLPNEDGTHERYVTDNNNVISKQGSNSTALNNKLDKVTTNDVKKVYTKEADGTQSMTDVSTLVGTDYLGTITPSSTPTGSGANFWSATQAGTYTNFGGVVVAANSFAFISRSATGVFSISQTALDLTSYAQKQQINRHDLNDIFNNSLPITGYWDFSTEKVATSAGYFHTGWLDWDGTETLIRYTGGLVGNVGIVCAHENFTPILKMGGISVSPEYTAQGDLVREFRIPKGTKKMLFSCTSARKTAFKVEILEYNSSIIQFPKEIDYLKSNILSHKKGDILLLEADLINDGFFQAVNQTINTTAGYKNTGWIDWDGTECYVNYRGSFFGASGMGCLDANGNYLHVEGGKTSFPQYTNDNYRTIKIPKGTRKFIFSCKADGYSIFSVKVTSDAYKLVDNHSTKTIVNKVTSDLLPITLGEKFHLRFDVNFEDINKDFASSKFATICGIDVSTINAKPTTYETKVNGTYTTNYPVPKLLSGFIAGTQQQIPSWKNEKVVGDIQFSIRYTGTFTGMEDLYVIFDGTTFTIGRDSTGVIYTYTSISTTKVQDVVAHMKANLVDFEIVDLLKTCLVSSLLTFGKVYLVGKFNADSAATTSRLDAYKFNFRKSKCDNDFTFDVIRIGQRLIMLQGGAAFYTGAPTNDIVQFFSGNNIIKNIDIVNNGLGDAELIGNRLVSSSNPLVLTFMLHAVYKCREVDGGSVAATYPLLNPYPESKVPCSLERLDKILATARAKGYKIVTAEQIDKWKNGKIQLPKRSLCVLHDDREQYIYTDSEIQAIYESNNAKGSVCLIVDGYDYSDTAKRMRADGWSALSHFKIHQTLDTFPASTLYDLCKDSITNCKNIGAYGNSLVYPGGGSAPHVSEALEVAGYTSAWITTDAYTSKVDSKFSLKRVDASDSTLWATINGYFI